MKDARGHGSDAGAHAQAIADLPTKRGIIGPSPQEMLANARTMFGADNPRVKAFEAKLSAGSQLVRNMRGGPLSERGARVLTNDPIHFSDLKGKHR